MEKVCNKLCSLFRITKDWTVENCLNQHKFVQRDILANDPFAIGSLFIGQEIKAMQSFRPLDGSAAHICCKPNKTRRGNITTKSHFHTLAHIVSIFSPFHTPSLYLVPNSPSKFSKTQNRVNISRSTTTIRRREDREKMRGLLRRLVGCSQRFVSSSSGRSSELGQTLMVSSAATVSYSTLTLMEKPNLLSASPIVVNLRHDFSSLHVLNHYRNFSAPSSSGLSVSWTPNPHFITFNWRSISLFY